MKTFFQVVMVLTICIAPLSARSETYKCGGGTVIQIDKAPPRVVFQQFGIFPESVVVTSPAMVGKTMKWRMSLKQSPSCVFDVEAVQVTDVPPFMKAPIDLRYSISGAKCADYGVASSSEMCPKL